MSKEVHEMIDLETGEVVFVEMTSEQFQSWLDWFCETFSLDDLEECEEA
jgi:hypothetical protein